MDTGPDDLHRPIGEMANQMNQHIEMPQIRDDRPGGDADKDVQGEAITKYCLSEGTNAARIYLELDGLDDVTEDAFKAESVKTNVSLTIASEAANFHAYWLGARNHRRESCPEERKTDGFPEAREEGEENLQKLLDDRQHATETHTFASTKEVVADDTANSNRTSHLVSAKRH